MRVRLFGGKRVAGDPALSAPVAKRSELSSLRYGNLAASATYPGSVLARPKLYQSNTVTNRAAVSVAGLSTGTGAAGRTRLEC